MVASLLDGGSSANTFRDGQSIPVTDTMTYAVLVANTSQTRTIPAGAKRVQFTGVGIDFYAKFASGAGSIAVPAASTDTPDTIMGNPTLRNIPAGMDRIYMIGSAAGVVVMEWYS